MFRVTDGLLEKFGADRVIDTPLAETAILGTSIGMAMAGLRPVCEMQFSGFSYLMMGQLEAHATRIRARTHGQVTLPLVVRMPYGGGVRALEHHSESREAIYAHLPGAKVVHARAVRATRARCSWRPSATRTRWSSWSRSARTAPSAKRCRTSRRRCRSARRRWSRRAPT